MRLRKVSKSITKQREKLQYVEEKILKYSGKLILMIISLSNPGTKFKAMLKFKVHQKTLNVVAIDNQPLSILYDQGFIELLAK